MPTVAAVVILGVFFALERGMRRGADARSLNAGVADRGTTRLIGAAYGVALLILLLSPLMQARDIAPLPEPLGWIGVALMLPAVAGRIWAARTLGAGYTRTLRVVKGQQLVSTGPYRWIRHPGYAADMLLWAAAGLATADLLALAMIFGLMAAVYGRRIAVEERMLIATFGDEYREYARRTWRVLPPLI